MARFVEGGDLEAAIAEISRDSADDAIAKARYARDARSQVWSAVNHLEQALAATRASYRRRGVKHLALLRYGRLVREATYILEVTAICYHYLDETDLRDRSLDAADECWALYREHRRLIASTPDSQDVRSQVRALGLGMINLPTSVVEFPNMVRYRGEIDVAEPDDLRAFLARQP